jgi:hypothetical protein
MITNRVLNTTHKFITVQTKEIRVVSRSGNPGPGSVPKTRAPHKNIVHENPIWKTY